MGDGAMTRIGLILSAAVLSLASPLLAQEKKELPAAVKEILEKAEQIELLSLDPKAKKENTENAFHSWKVLGKTTIKEKEDRTKVLNAVHKGIADNKGLAALCFIPRHGLRASHGGKTAELIICFECLQIQVFLDGKPQQ